jgi:hypothetical protein
VRAFFFRLLRFHPARLNDGCFALKSVLKSDNCFEIVIYPKG